MSYWSKLSMKDRANVMKLFLDKGISDLDTIRREYNIFAEGGSIHIDPSKKGTFTAAASRHGMGVQEFASKVLANKENYSPAMVKKANFARNASKWHGFGGNLYGDGGSYSYTKPLDNVYVDSEGNLLDPNVPSARGSIRIPDVEVTANPIDVGRGKAARLYNDYGIASNDATSTPLTRNIHLNERGLDGATKAAAWMKDNPTLNNVGMALGAVPFAVAGYPAFMAAGEGTATALANPYVDAALTAGFGAHGLNHAVNEGINGWGDAAMTALELAPLGRLAKPMWNAGKEGLQYAAKVTDNTARYVSPSYDLYRTIGETKPKYTRVPSKNLFRTYVYKGGEITDPHSNFVTTDLQYAANYGKVTPYIFESKSIAKAKEPMMGYKDPVNMDMFIYNNTKRNPNATAIIGHDAVTGEFAPSKGVEILNMSPKNLYPVKTSKPSTIEWVDATRTPQITAENAASIVPEQWTAAQDAAIARGDMVEAQRLRDLHFKVSAPNTKTDVPLWSSSEEAFNSFDLSHFGETDSGFFGYGHYLTPIEKYAATYHPVNRKFYANIENPYIGSNDQYFNRIQYVKDRLAMRKENVMRNLRDGKLTKFSKKLGINENTSLEDAERLVDKYIADETVKWNDKYVKYADEFEGKDGVLSWRELQGTPNKQEGIYREVVVPRGEQIKSADAVTYNNNGVRIPLGLRDNFNINDIRYGLLPFIGLGTLGTLYGTSDKKQE